MSDNERKYWLDERKNVNKIIYTLVAVCAGFLIADLFHYKHHLRTQATGHLDKACLCDQALLPGFPG